MTVAFQIRVLLDRPKVSGSARRAEVVAQFYKKVGQGPVTQPNAIDFEEHFDLEPPVAITLQIREGRNELIHHYVMLALGKGAGECQVLVVFSDYKRRIGLFELQIQDVMELFATVASDASTARLVGITWDAKREDYAVTTDC